MNTVTRSITRNATANPALLAALWFGIQLAWGAVLGISLQARSLQLAGTGAVELYGWVSMLGACAAAVVQLAVGPLSDRLRARGDTRAMFYGAGALLASVAVVAFYLAPSVPTFAAAFIALQASMNLAIGPYQAILPDVVPPSRIGVASGWMAGMQSAGNAAGAILATLLHAALPLAVAIAVVLLASCALTLRHLQQSALQPLPPHAPLRVTRSLVDLFISRAFVYVGFYTLLGYFLFYVKDALPPHFPLDATTASGICVLLFTLVGALGAAVAAKPADRLDERIVVTVGGGVLAAAIGVLALAHGLVPIPIAISVAGIGWGIFLCADWAFACRLLPPSALASTMAIWNVAVVGPQIIAPLITTTVLARAGVLTTSVGPRLAFALACAEILTGSLWIWRLFPQRAGK